MASDDGPKHAKPALSNETYDFLRWIAQYLLPGLGTLYFGIAQIWGAPYGEEVLGTCTALDLFLAGILGLSAKSYNNSAAKWDGSLVVDTSDAAKDIYSFEVDDLAALRKKKQLTIKVKQSD